MAFEEIPPAPLNLPTRKRKFNPAVIGGATIFLLAIALVLFSFRTAIANKISEWRGSSSQTAFVLPLVPTVAPAPTTPTPTAAPIVLEPTSVGKTVSIAPAVTRSIPKTGPEDSLLVLSLLGGSLTALGTRARYTLRRRTLKKQLSKLDIY